MVVLLALPELVYIHVSDETKKQLDAKPDHKRVFENLVVGVNVYSLECYERVAKAVLQIPDARIRNTTRKEFIDRMLHGEDFVDESGYLI